MIYNTQKAIMTALKGNATLTTMTTGIFDNGAVGNNQPFPYIEVTNVIADTNDTFARRGEEINVTLDVYSDYQGSTEVLEIYEQIENVMFNLNSVDNNTLVNVERTGFEIDNFDKGKKTNCNTRWRIVVQEG